MQILQSSEFWPEKNVRNDAVLCAFLNNSVTVRSGSYIYQWERCSHAFSLEMTRASLLYTGGQAVHFSVTFGVFESTSARCEVSSCDDGLDGTAAAEASQPARHPSRSRPARRCPVAHRIRPQHSRTVYQ